VLRRIGDRREVELTRAMLRIVEARAFAGSGDDAAALEPIALAVGHATAADDDRLLMEACRIRAGVLTRRAHRRALSMRRLQPNAPPGAARTKGCWRPRIRWWPERTS